MQRAVVGDGARCNHLHNSTALINVELSVQSHLCINLGYSAAKVDILAVLPQQIAHLILKLYDKHVAERQHL